MQQPKNSHKNLLKIFESCKGIVQQKIVANDQARDKHLGQKLEAFF